MRKWTKEKVFEKAREYKTRGEFAKSCKRAYEVACKNGWLDEMTWLISPHKPKGYWTNERVFEEARKYKTRAEFKKGCQMAYQVACRNGWLEEMDWLIESRKPRNYWSKEKVFEEARNYKTRNKFRKECGGAYEVARKNGWLDEMDWFIERKKPKKYWTKERVFEEARNYQTRTEFSKGCGSAYNVAKVNGWLDEMYWFIEGRLKVFTIKKNDSVYKYYWEETNSIYIGRTLITQQEERKRNHRTSKKDTVYKYAKENGLAVPPMEIIEENITVKEGLEREDYWVNYYKERGYNILNIAKTGIGSGSTGRIGWGKWTKEKVFEKAREYKTRKEFKKGCQMAYIVARRNGWLNEMTWFQNGRIKPKKWTKEIVFAEARKYKTRTEFQKGCVNAYTSAYKNKWLDELFPKYKSVA